VAVNAEAAARLLAFGLPLIVLWFGAGLFIAVAYHLSLFLIDGEFRQRDQLALDIFVSILRGLAYLFVWPGILFFDASALYRIKMLFLYLNPKERATNEELLGYIAERKHRRMVTKWYLDQSDLERRRDEELATGAERKRRTRELHDGNPELERTWLLTGVGVNPAGVSEIVRLYPDYWLAEEIARRARVEIELRSLHDCPKCGTRVSAREVLIPELAFLRVLEPQSRELAAEGWALSGPYQVSYPDCPRCGAAQARKSGDVAEFGRAPEIVKALRLGLVYHWDLP
jgi:predicted RNA-binding Zn-ribbon protein involved in translation (DUF1610 family)